MPRALWPWRPHLLASNRPASRSTQYAYVRLYSQSNPRYGPQAAGSYASVHAEVQERLDDLQTPATQLYPRLGSNLGALTCSAFTERYASLKNDEVRREVEVVVRGRVHSFRIAGSKLVFLDLVQEGHRVQGLCNLSQLSTTGLSSEEFRAFCHRLRRGDIFVCYVRRYFLDDFQTEVQTPILAARAGGAIARPFATSATEFPERQLVLRIAPELWLKRMIIGGHDRVFEIGPSFRNEGLDPSHNPEFTTCEFYRAYTNIDELMSITETLFSGLARHTTSLIRETFTSINPPNIDFTPPFRQIEFIPAIEAAIRRELPDLTSATAQADLVKLFHDLAVPLPTSATLPRLLDRLSSLYIEPHCTAPTFVINHPECLSPLSKSFAHSGAHRVSARAELFVNGQELVNMYEEENSPFEQRRKFVEQLNYRDDENTASIDEDYLEALEWGLPPTGGWGCGIDRLCMLLSGTSRIGDVLSFGTLRNVAASTKGS